MSKRVLVGTNAASVISLTDVLVYRPDINDWLNCDKGSLNAKNINTVAVRFSWQIIRLGNAIGNNLHA